MTNEYIKKIIAFFNFQKQPKLWNVDTDFIHTINRLIANLKKQNIKEIKNMQIKKFYDDVKNTESFQLLINNLDITPISVNRFASKSTMRQYLQFFSAFTWIKFDKNDNKNWYKNDTYNFYVNISINKLLEDEFSYEKLLIELIITGSISCIKHKINLAYSFFIYYIFNKNEHLVKELELVFNKIKNKDNIKSFYSDDEYANNYLKHTKCKKSSLSNTFYESYELIKNCNFDDLIFEIYENIVIRFSEYDEIKNNIYDEYKNLNQTQNYQFNAILDNIKSSRSKLRKNIIQQRIGENKFHSDIEHLESNNKITEKPIYILDACHIYEIWQIKSSVKNTTSNKNELLKYCEDANNGLMLPKEFHYFFDKGVIQFDINGKAIFDNDYIDDLKRCNIFPFKIKEEYFNDEMKNYLIKRYN